MGGHHDWPISKGALIGGGGLIDPPLRVVKFRVETFFFYDPLAE